MIGVSYIIWKVFESTFRKRFRLSVPRSSNEWRDFIFNYASSSSGEAYRDRQLTTNYELWVELFLCRNVSIWGFQKWVCPYPECLNHEKRNPPGCVTISPTLVANWFINGKVIISTTTWKPNFFFKKVWNWILTCILTRPKELKSP